MRELASKYISEADKSFEENKEKAILKGVWEVGVIGILNNQGRTHKESSIRVEN